MKILKRFEKGQKFLDLVKFSTKSQTEDGVVFDDEYFECKIYENNSSDFNAHTTVAFTSEFMANMFIQQNDWSEQCL